MKLRTKIALGAVTAVVAVATPLMAIAGWYPDRELKAWNGPNTPGFDHVTFNSFTNVPEGNEQQFFDGKQWNTTPGGFQDPIQVHVGEEIKLRTYVHNNADASLNDAAHNYAGIARNTKVKITLPNGVGTQMNAVSKISADNATPGSVYDTTNFVSADGTPYQLSYVAGSAYADTHARTAMPLSDSIVTTGALIGENAPDGNVPGCFENDMYVIVKVKVEAAPLSIEKTVAHPGQNFVEKVDSKPGERLYFKLSFKNNGATQQDNVALTDKLPEQLQLVPGSVKLYNSNNPSGLQLSDSGLFTAGGQSVGDYASNINGYVLYQVVVKDSANGVLTNTGCVRSNEVPYPTCNTAQVVTPQKPVTPVTPVTPVSPVNPLPQTGVESGLAGVLGMTGLSASIYAYRRSKKAMAEAISHKK
ncbi:MAG: LPXTG cell wall anchor domain-containing protein [Candidatus Saccharibacteria bacterium]